MIWFGPFLSTRQWAKWTLRLIQYSHSQFFMLASQHNQFKDNYTKANRRCVLPLGIVSALQAETLRVSCRSCIISAMQKPQVPGMSQKALGIDAEVAELKPSIPRTQ